MAVGILPEAVLTILVGSLVKKLAATDPTRSPATARDKANCVKWVAAK